MERKLITKRDLLIIIIIALFVAALLVFPNISNIKRNSVAVITVDGVEIEQIDLSTVADEQIITLENGVKIRAYNNSVAFYESDCKDKICINSGALSQPGDVAACVPNRTVISITGSGDDVDVITY